MITKGMRRLIGGLLWPISRPLTAVLIWSHRHTLALWGRSLAAELRRDAPLDLRRLSTLIRALWRVTKDARLRQLAHVHTISVDDDPTSANDPGVDASMRGAALRATLLDVPGVVAVEVVESTPTSQPSPIAA